MRSRAGAGVRGLGERFPAVEEEEMEESGRLQALREQGAYTLELRDPIKRKALEEASGKIAAASESIRRMDGHPQLLAELGVPPEKAALLDHHLSMIVEASVEAEASMGQLLEARQAYEKAAKEFMGSDAYKQYQEFELGLKSRRELEKIREFTANNQLTLDDQAADQLSAIVKEFEGYTVKSWNGPFDGMPEIAVGYEQVTAGLRKDAARIEEASVAMQNAALERGFSPGFVRTLESYYDNQLQQIEAAQVGLKYAIENGPPKMLGQRASRTEP
jgi:hypothetical protein